MICGHCEHPAESYLSLDPDGREPRIWECHHCRRRRVFTTRGAWQWMKIGGYCPDCKAEAWVFVTYPNGQRFLLWPKPDAVTAHYWTPSGDAIHGSYCGACCPELGAPACAHVLEAIPEAGGVIEHVLDRERHVFRFTDGYGEWLRAWSVDFLRMDEVERDALVALWEQHRSRRG